MPYKPRRNVFRYSKTVFNEPLRDAYKAIKAAIQPSKPIRPVDAAAIKAIDEHVRMWEESQDIVAGIHGQQEMLADNMKDLIHYAIRMEDIHEVDMDTFRARMRNLEKHINRCLLNEERAIHRNNGGQHLSGLDGDTAFLRECAEQLKDNVLKTSPKNAIWSVEVLPKLFSALELFEEIPFVAIKNSGISSVLLELTGAPCVPVITDAGDLRERAIRVLDKWGQMADARALNSAERENLGFSDRATLTADLTYLPKPFPERSGKEIIYFPNQLATSLSNLETCGAQGNVQSMAELMADMAAWEIPTQYELWAAIGHQVRNAVNTLKSTLGDRVEDNRLVLEIDEFAQRIENRIARQSEAPGPLLGFSYVHPQAPAISIQFVNVVPEWKKTGCLFMSNNRQWPDITFPCHEDEAANAVIERFYTIANERNRHPLTFLKSFQFASSKIAFSAPHKARKDLVLQTEEPTFIQGILKDTLLAGATIGVVYYQRHDGGASVRMSRQIMARLPDKRILPPSCIPPPNHWFEPELPLPSEGQKWQSVPSLAFVGTGAELWPHATYPPIIAKSIYMADESSLDYVYGRGGKFAMRSSLPVTLDRTPVKFTPPLVKEQAESLVGRMIQFASYEQAFSDSQRPKKRFRKQTSVQEHSKPQKLVMHFAYVWGLDPELLVLKAFEIEGVKEVSRTLLVGEGSKSDLPEDLPNDFPEVCRPLKPAWIGRVCLVQPEPVVQEPRQGEGRGDNLARLQEIVKLAPRQFCVGIHSECSIFVGELAIHDPGDGMIVEVENCKPGIWESGRFPSEDDERWPGIWVRWVKEGTIDLSQPVTSFANEGDPVEFDGTTVRWKLFRGVGVDGGSVSMIAAGYLSEESRRSLGSSDDMDDIHAFLEFVMLAGHEDGHLNVPGGISDGTMGDGSFAVDIARDSDGQVIAVRVREGTAADTARNRDD